MGNWMKIGGLVLGAALLGAPAHAEQCAPGLKNGLFRAPVAGSDAAVDGWLFDSGRRVTRPPDSPGVTLSNGEGPASMSQIVRTQPDSTYSISLLGQAKANEHARVRVELGDTIRTCDFTKPWPMVCTVEGLVATGARTRVRLVPAHGYDDAVVTNIWMTTTAEVDDDTDTDPIDGCDLCPETPDDHRDADGDGWSDACDQCPNGTTEALADLRLDGCNPDREDSDGDSVPDSRDRCPGGDDWLDVDQNGIPDACEGCDGHNVVENPDLSFESDAGDIGFIISSECDEDAGQPGYCKYGLPEADALAGWSVADTGTVYSVDSRSVVFGGDMPEGSARLAQDLEVQPSTLYTFQVELIDHTEQCTFSASIDDQLIELTAPSSGWLQTSLTFASASPRLEITDSECWIGGIDIRQTCSVDHGEPDADRDGTPDDEDACPLVAAADDEDGDCVPDAADACPGSDDADDADKDGVPDDCDACPDFDDADDADIDGVPDACDVCPGHDDGDDFDKDGEPDGCDWCPYGDADGDDYCDEEDVCEGHDDAIDTDGDLVPDGCDPCPMDIGDDLDSDGVCDSQDACPGFDDALDFDQDGTPDGCDICPVDTADDSDGDGSCDSVDLCPGDDTIDSDDDFVPDGCDVCPMDPYDLCREDEAAWSVEPEMDF